MTWLTALTLSFKPVILPILTCLVGWLVPSPKEILRRKQAATHEAEQSGKGLDTLP